MATVLSKIISSGQAGAERVALDFAITNRIDHGGSCPKGRTAEDGTIPEKYQLLELTCKDERATIKANIAAADATTIFTMGPKFTGGSQLTAKAADEYIYVRSATNADSKVSRYLLQLTPKIRTVELKVMVNGIPKSLDFWKLPRKYKTDEWVRLELQAVGEQITVSADDELLGKVTNGDVTQGGSVGIQSQGNSYFRDIVYVPLDPPVSTKRPQDASIPEAHFVPGKPGWVRSPYSLRDIDVSRQKPGSKVLDPAAGKYFIVPATPAPAPAR